MNKLIITYQEGPRLVTRQAETDMLGRVIEKLPGKIVGHHLLLFEHGGKFNLWGSAQIIAGMDGSILPCKSSPVEGRAIFEAPRALVIIYQDTNHEKRGDIYCHEAMPWGIQEYHLLRWQDLDQDQEQLATHWQLAVKKYTDLKLSEKLPIMAMVAAESKARCRRCKCIHYGNIVKSKRK